MSLCYTTDTGDRKIGRKRRKQQEFKKNNNDPVRHPVIRRDAIINIRRRSFGRHTVGYWLAEHTG